MKKYIMFIVSICLFLFSFTACNNSNSESSNENKVTDVVQEEKDDLQEDDEENNEDKQTSEEENRASKWGKDELNLSIGDTGTLHNNFSKTEITLDSVEVVDDKGNEEAVEPLDVLDVTYLALDGDLGGDSLDEYGELSKGWPEEIGVGEKSSGPLVFDAGDADKYELQIDFNLDSVSNKISFKFDKDELE